MSWQQSRTVHNYRVVLRMWLSMWAPFPIPGKGVTKCLAWSQPPVSLQTCASDCPRWFLCIPKCETFATITPFARQSFQALLSKYTWNIWAKEKSVNFLKGSYDTKQSMFHDWLNCKNTYCIKLFVQWFSNIHMKQEKNPSINKLSHTT